MKAPRYTHDGSLIPESLDSLTLAQIEAWLRRLFRHELHPAERGRFEEPHIALAIHYPHLSARVRDDIARCFLAFLGELLSGAGAWPAEAAHRVFGFADPALTHTVQRDAAVRLLSEIAARPLSPESRISVIQALNSLEAFLPIDFWREQFRVGQTAAIPGVFEGLSRTSVHTAFLWLRERPYGAHIDRLLLRSLPYLVMKRGAEVVAGGLTAFVLHHPDSWNQIHDLAHSLGMRIKKPATDWSLALHTELFARSGALVRGGQLQNQLAAHSKGADDEPAEWERLKAIDVPRFFEVERRRQHSYHNWRQLLELALVFPSKAAACAACDALSRELDDGAPDAVAATRYLELILRALPAQPDTLAITIAPGLPERALSSVGDPESLLRSLLALTADADVVRNIFLYALLRTTIPVPTIGEAAAESTCPVAHRGLLEALRLAASDAALTPSRAQHMVSLCASMRLNSQCSPEARLELSDIIGQLERISGSANYLATWRMFSADEENE